MVALIGDTTRNLHENFVSEFLKHAHEYNVHPLPRIIVSVSLKFANLIIVS